MDLRVLLRAGGVVRSGLGLLGRYRAAGVVSFVLALGWFVFALDGRADAAGPGGGYGAPGPLRLSDPIIPAGAGRVLLGWVGVGVAVWLIVGALVVGFAHGWFVRHGRASVSGGVEHGGARGGAARLHAASRSDGGEPRLFVGQS